MIDSKIKYYAAKNQSYRKNISPRQSEPSGPLIGLRWRHYSYRDKVHPEPGVASSHQLMCHR